MYCILVLREEPEDEVHTIHKLIKLSHLTCRQLLKYGFTEEELQPFFPILHFRQERLDLQTLQSVS